MYMYMYVYIHVYTSPHAVRSRDTLKLGMYAWEWNHGNVCMSGCSHFIVSMETVAASLSPSDQWFQQPHALCEQLPLLLQLSSQVQ